MMHSYIDFLPTHWVDADWPKPMPNTTQAFDHAQSVSPLYLAALSGVAFIIWWSLAMIARSKTGRISTKRLLVLIGIAAIAVTLGLVSGGGSVSPLIDVAIVTVASGALLLLAVAVWAAMPIAAASAVVLVIIRLTAREWGKPKRERNTKATGALSEGEQA
ncbi:hypothetical protein [Brevibacterium aurantiacum]|uniref:Transmembrane protein n=1 Tax=Brevibacterium aurantiacum TaxID=273384 RepID=A0A556CB06_BREAU|nr:hypothetical protein [Brevibacterium aurantiacum]TSI14632.1 hypothetical protein FO013_14890 [Brevibacterium aurantiacum]